MPHYPLLASDLSLANLTNHDKIRFEAISVLGGDGSLYTDFFDDFDQMVSSGSGVPSNSNSRPNWGFMQAGTASAIGNEGVQTQSYFAVKDGTSGNWCKWRVLPQTQPIGQQKWYFTVKGLIFPAAGAGDAYVQLNNGASTVSIGIKHSIHATNVLLFDANSEAYVVLLASSSTVPIQVDAYCLTDSVLHYRVNMGNWQTMAYNLGLSPPVPCQLDIAQTVNNTVSLDWVGVFTTK